MFDHGDVNPYLQQEVMSSSPVRLRWMLVKRAEELCSMVDQLWINNDFQQASQWLIRIRDILGELLNGVRDANPLGIAIGDFYVFLIQMVTEIEETANRQRLATLRELLSIESETWRMVVHQQGSAEGLAAGLGQTGRFATASDTAVASSLVPHLGFDPPMDGSFSFEF